MPIIDQGDSYLSYGASTDMWAVGDALYFPHGVTADWQMRPAIDSDAPPNLTHPPGAMVLVRQWPDGVIYYQFVKVPASRRKLTRSNCLWALKRELRRNPEFRKIVAEFDARDANGRNPPHQYRK